jgi:hypothetical protein
MEKPDVKLEHPMAEDSFDKARKTFFGTAGQPQKPDVSAAEFLKTGISSSSTQQ